MRLRAITVAVIVTFTIVAATTFADGRSGQATPGTSVAAILKAARSALGGEAKLAAVKSLILKGEDRRLNQLFGMSPNAKQQYYVNPIEFRALFPDHYLNISISGRSPWWRGFSGTDLVNEHDVPGGNQVVSQDPPDLINTYRAEFARLMLLFLLRTDTAIPLTLRESVSSGTILEFSGPDNFSASMDLDKATHLPSRLRYQIHPSVGASAGKMVSMIISVDDWRDVSGLKLPYHLLQMEGETTTSDIRFQSIEINLPLTAADFKKK